MTQWDADAHVVEAPPVGRVTPCAPPVSNTRAAGKGLPALPSTATTSLRYDPVAKKYVTITTTPVLQLPPPPAPTPKAAPPEPAVAATEDWRAALRPKPYRTMMVRSNNPWDNL